MPKVNYDKQPFRLCRWNSKFHGSKNDEYYCEDAEEKVDSEQCMKCFLNNWYEVCERCGTEVLKTEIRWFFEKDNSKMIFVCDNCEDGEEECENIKEKDSYKNVAFDINEWKELNKKN